MSLMPSQMPACQSQLGEESFVAHDSLHFRDKRLKGEAEIFWGRPTLSSAPTLSVSGLLCFLFLRIATCRGTWASCLGHKDGHW